MLEKTCPDERAVFSSLCSRENDPPKTDTHGAAHAP